MILIGVSVRGTNTDPAAAGFQIERAEDERRPRADF